MAKIYIIIVTYNALRNHWLHKCIGSLVNSSYPTDIIVVDNASTDDTVKIIKEQYPTINLIESETNLGFGGANNLGLKKALELNAQFFFLLNQDAWVETDTIEKLVHQSIKNPDYGIISPLHLNGKGNALDYNFSLYINPNCCKNLYSDFVLNKVENKIYESDFVCAAAWLISRECLEIVGGFSPTFYHYAEDDNYVHRLKFKKIKIGVYPLAKIYHDRENREKNIFFEGELQKLRSFQLKQSNPLQDFTIDKDIQSYKQRMWRRKLLLDKTGVDYYKKEISFFEENREKILENRLKSVSDEKFIFLNYKNQ